MRYRVTTTVTEMIDHTYQWEIEASDAPPPPRPDGFGYDHDLLDWVQDHGDGFKESSDNERTGLREYVDDVEDSRRITVERIEGADDDNDRQRNPDDHPLTLSKYGKSLTGTYQFVRPEGGDVDDARD